MISINKFEILPAGNYDAVINNAEIKNGSVVVDFAVEDTATLETKHHFAWVKPWISDKFPVFSHLMALVGADPKTGDFDETLLIGKECVITIVHNQGKDKEGNEQTYANVTSVVKKA